MEQFERDLPTLVLDHSQEWVAYHGRDRLFFGETAYDLYQRSGELGLQPYELFVTLVQPWSDMESIGVQEV